jgi:hypothetical protein
MENYHSLGPETLRKDSLQIAMQKLSSFAKIKKIKDASNNELLRLLVSPQKSMS